MSKTVPSRAGGELPAEHRAAATCYGALAVTILCCIACAVAAVTGATWLAVGGACFAALFALMALASAGVLYDYATGRAGHGEDAP